MFIIHKPITCYLKNPHLHFVSRAYPPVCLQGKIFPLLLPILKLLTLERTWKGYEIKVVQSDMLCSCMSGESQKLM